MGVHRLEDLAKRAAPTLYEAGLDDHPRFRLTNAEEHSGDEWFDIIKRQVKERRKSEKTKRDTPFLNSKGENLKMHDPVIWTVDSLTEFEINVVSDMVEGNTLGDSKANTEAMAGSRAKSQMIGLMPALAAQGGLFFSATAHIADHIKMEKYSAQENKLAFLKGDIKMSRVPGRFTFRSNVQWLISKMRVMLHDTLKTPEYPRDSDDDTKGDTDLIVLTMMNVRNKSGPTGVPFEVIVSQSEGYLAELTAFNMIKGFGRFGIGGNNINFHLELLPDVTLGRTTIRRKIDENPLLGRALELTVGLCLAMNVMDIPKELRCTPKELYDDLAKKYDWKRLLNTRSYWTFDHYTHPVPPLTAMDLLNMRAGIYHPFWYDKV